MACSNGVSALSLPWTNISVHASSNVPVRGIAFSVGTPAQTLSLWPSFGDNDTWVPNSIDCNNNLSNLSCIAADGGLYTTADSSTYKFASLSSWNGSKTLAGIHTYLNDNVQVANNVTIWGLPLLQHIVNFNWISGLGLGAGSTFLKSLVSQNLAPSTAFGLWSGSQSVNNPLDGSLIIGGYDQSKVGTLTNFSSIPDCLTCAVVSTFELTLRNGSTTSLLNATVPKLNIAIDPYYSVGGIPVMAIPDEIRDILVAASQAIVHNPPNVYGWVSGQQPGDLKIGFSNGYRVTIPGSELWLPFRGTSSDGQPIFQNSTKILNALRASGPYVAATRYIWGQPFLTSNYMVVWPDQGVWGLSPINNAQRTASPSIKNFCSDSGAPSNVPSNSSNTSQPSGSNVGAIAGGVVGAVLAVLLIVLAAWCFLRRRSKKRRTNDGAPVGAELQSTTGYRPDVKDYSKVPTQNSAYVAELAGDQHSRPALAEMSGSPDRLPELHGNQGYR